MSTAARYAAHPGAWSLSLHESEPLGTDADQGLDVLVERARALRSRAYAPYSGFHVGAVVVTVSGATYEGVNVENVSYRLTTCAEQTALAVMCATGGREEVAQVVVAGDGDRPCTPCGACRQMIAELGPDATVHATGASGVVRSRSIAALLPDAFTPGRLAAGTRADPTAQTDGEGQASGGA